VERTRATCNNRARGKGSDDELGKRRSEYEQALADWNDQLTTRLVSVEVYFGGDAYDQLDSIDRRFQEADNEIEKLYRQLTAATDTAAGIDTDDVAAMTKLLDVVREEAHELGFGMMLHIRRGEIGRTARYPRSAAGRRPSADDPMSGDTDPTKPGFGCYLGVGAAASQHPAAVLAAAMRNQREHAE